MLGLKITDAFGAVVILETAFTASDMFSDISLQVELHDVNVTANFNKNKFAEIESGAIALICLLQLLLVICLVWVGFICQRKTFLLKVWIVLGFLLDLSLELLWVAVNSVNASDSSVSPWEYVYLVSVAMAFRIYVSIVAWLVVRRVSVGSDLRGYERGFCHLFGYYRNEYKRVASILLTVELMWNLRTVLEGDLPVAMGMELVGLEGHVAHFYRAAYFLRIIRIVLALFALFLVSTEKAICLKFVWLPLFVASMTFSLVYGSWYLNETDPAFHVYAHVLLLTVSLLFRLILTFYIVRFFLQKTKVPIPHKPAGPTPRTSSVRYDSQSSNSGMKRSDFEI